MKKESIRNYAMRVSQANRTQLVVITYDIILEDCSDALRAIEDSDKATLRSATSHAVRFVADLMSALDLSLELSKQLWQLYEFVQRKLIAAGYSAKKSDIEAAKSVICGLRGAFDTISKDDKSENVMGNTQPVFAGLTYSKGKLNEVNLDPKQATRGFYA